jgi:hypothetical protein
MTDEESINQEADPVAAADARNGESGGATEGGHDTATGTDPDAKYDQPGYEDKSIGQAVDQDRELAEELLDEEDGDEAAAARRFEDESAGAPALHRQEGS